MFFYSTLIYTNMLFSTFVWGFSFVVVMIIILYNSDIFDNVKFNIGSDEYAQIVWTNLPYYCYMTFNTLVNFVYTYLGLY